MKATILRSLVPMFEDKMEVYKKRFERKAFGNVQFHISDERYVPLDSDEIKFRGHWVVDVEVEGEYKIPGWKFVASLEWIPEQKTNIIRKSDDGITIPERFINSNDCDHCHAERNRKRTIVLFNEETQEYKQVGNQCVKDYIGADAEDYLSYLSIFDSMQSWLDSLPSDTRTKHDIGFKTDEILEQTIEEVNHFGYVSQQTIRNWYDNHGYDDEYCPLEKTSSQVFRIMNEVTGYENYELVRPRYEVTDETREKVKEVKDFIFNQEDDSDYIHNVQTLLKTEYVDNKNLGIVVSAVGYYIRQKAAIKEAEIESASEFIGDIGDKIQFIAKPVVVSSYESDYGWSYLYKFVDDGNVILWRTNKLLDVDVEYTIKATVKDHSEFRHVKQTVVTRGKVLSE